MRALTREGHPTGLRRWMPVLQWLPAYDRSWLRGDVIAVLTVAAHLGQPGGAVPEVLEISADSVQRLIDVIDAQLSAAAGADAERLAGVFEVSHVLAGCQQGVAVGVTVGVGEGVDVVWLRGHGGGREC